MALSPTIPTSFVPKQPVAPGTRRVTKGGNNIFLYVSFVILVITLLASAGVFFYAQYLTSVENAKAAELVSAQNKVSESAVDDFVRLHDRFIAAKSILDQHIALSQFLTLLGTITAQNITFTSLGINVADDRSAQLTMSGEAVDFNALANESTDFAQQKDITSAIFSGITLNKNGTVGFSVAATLTPAIVVESTAPTTPVLLPTGTTGGTSPSLPATPSVTPAAASPAAPASTQDATQPDASSTPS